MSTNGHATPAVVPLDPLRELDARPARLVCLLDPPCADDLLPALRSHFAPEPHVAVLIERRDTRSRWSPAERSTPVRRRAPIAERDAARALPPELRNHARHLRLVQPLVPLQRTYENTDLQLLPARVTALDPEATSELWWRISPRTLARLARHLGHTPDAQTAQSLLGRILDELPAYHATRAPLSTCLDDIVDRFAEEHTVLNQPQMRDGDPHGRGLYLAAV